MRTFIILGGLILFALGILGVRSAYEPTKLVGCIMLASAASTFVFAYLIKGRSKHKPPEYHWKIYWSRGPMNDPIDGTLTVKAPSVHGAILEFMRRKGDYEDIDAVIRLDLDIDLAEEVPSKLYG